MFSINNNVEGCGHQQTRRWTQFEYSVSEKMFRSCGAHLRNNQLENFGKKDKTFVPDGGRCELYRDFTEENRGQ